MTGRDTSHHAAREPRLFGFLLLPGFAMMSYASALEPLRAANVLSGRELYRWRHLSPDGREIAASSGLVLKPDGGLDDPAAFDTVLVCAGGNPALFDDPATMAFLRMQARRAKALGGVSGGPYILAKAGVLSGYRATVHWEHMAAFAEEYPDVVLTQSLYEIDRDRLTSAGGVAALDMMHEVIRMDHGAPLARAVGDWFLQAQIRQGSLDQRLGPGERFGIADARLASVVAAMEKSLEMPPGRRALAASVGLSVRQLDRLFAEKLGTSPDRFHLSLRLARAREFMRQTAMSVTEAAVATGFSSPSHFSRAYRAKFGAPPSAERARGHGMR